MKFKPSQIALSVSLLSVVSISQFTSAQQRIRFTPPPSPSTSTPSDRGTGAGARGCDKEFAGLKALVPSPSPNDQWGLTVSDRPTIWFNIPTGVKAGTLVEWKLRNATNKVIYRTTTRLPKTDPGVVSFSIPETVAPLAVSTYQWDFAIYCESGTRDPNNPSDDIIDRPLVKKGRVQKVSVPPALRQELAAAKTPLDQAKAYARYGIWYDALTVLGKQIQTAQKPDKAILEAWNELLRQQKLEGKASETVTSCCKL